MISGYFLILAIARIVIFCDKCAVRSLSTIIVILCAVRDTRLDRPLGNTNFKRNNSILVPPLAKGGLGGVGEYCMILEKWYKFLGAIALSQQLKRGLSRCKLNDRTLIELLSG
ncbi:hypothetical protein IQ269_02455 [Tychonema sp. LEGE 07199]|nr:hypothetical protein [Tychonema sp. LEGE 07199]